MESQEQKKFKVRTRLTAIDVRALVRDLNSKIRGMRLSNVFDFAPTSACPRSYGFKFSGTALKVSPSAPSASDSTIKEEPEKVLLLVEPPARMHTTRFERAKVCCCCCCCFFKKSSFIFSYEFQKEN